MGLYTLSFQNSPKVTHLLVSKACYTNTVENLNRIHPLRNAHRTQLDLVPWAFHQNVEPSHYSKQISISISSLATAVVLFVGLQAGAIGTDPQIQILNAHQRINNNMLRYGNYCGPGPEGVSIANGCAALNDLPAVDSVDRQAFVCPALHLPINLHPASYLSLNIIHCLIPSIADLWTVLQSSCPSCALPVLLNYRSADWERNIRSARYEYHISQTGY
jgi:hypothetical protein